MFLLCRHTSTGVSNTMMANEPCPTRLPFYVPAEKVPHQAGNLVAVLLEREVPCVEQVKLQVLQVSLVRLGACCRKYLIVLAPDDKGRRLVVAEVGGEWPQSSVGCLSRPSMSTP